MEIFVTPKSTMKHNKSSMKNFILGTFGKILINVGH